MIYLLDLRTNIKAKSIFQTTELNHVQICLSGKVVMSPFPHRFAQNLCLETKGAQGTVMAFMVHGVILANLQRRIERNTSVSRLDQNHIDSFYNLKMCQN